MPQGLVEQERLRFNCKRSAKATRWRCPPESCEGNGALDYLIGSCAEALGPSRNLFLRRSFSTRLDRHTKRNVIKDSHMSKKRIVLKHEPNAALAHFCESTSSFKRTGPLLGSGISNPAIIRNKVVLPDPMDQEAQQVRRIDAQINVV